jgi:DNA repair exonuclease SbcCD ATPase subunit
VRQPPRPARDTRAMDLAEVADELYGGPLADFIATRAARAKEAKADGDKTLGAEIAALRKPTTAAWAVNMAMRESPDEIERVLALGDALREAQASLDGAELRELIGQRQALVSAVVSRVRAITRELGHPIAEAIASDVEQTFRAAMADPDAATAVRSRQLTSPISASGLGGVDLSTVVGTLRTPARSPKPARTQKSGTTGDDDAAEAERAEAERAEAERAKAELADARERAKEAKQAAAEADDDLRTAERAVAAVELEAADLRKKIADLRAQLEQAEDDLGDSERDLAAARKSVQRADRLATDARRAADRAEKAVDDLQPTSR